MISRTLTPEILDTLPPGDKEAVASRRDLQRFNHAMGNITWFRNNLQRFARRDDVVLEIGAGDGFLGAALHPDVARWDGLDLWSRPPNWPASSKWHQVDVFAFADWAPYTLIAANLVLHHFSDEGLALLGRRIGEHAQAVFACEPLRGRRWQWLFRGLCWLMRANRVSRHDGHVSIAAGFRDCELSQKLGLSPEEWDVSVQLTGRGAYRLRALRRTRNR